MTTVKYRIIVLDPYDGNPFFYVCNTLEELCFVHKFVEDYNLYLDVYTNVTVQRAKTPQELHDYHMQLWADQNPANLYFIEEDHPDYWTPFTDEFFELTKAKTMRF